MNLFKWLVCQRRHFFLEVNLVSSVDRKLVYFLEKNSIPSHPFYRAMNCQPDVQILIHYCDNTARKSKLSETNNECYLQGSNFFGSIFSRCVGMTSKCTVHSECAFFSEGSINLSWWYLGRLEDEVQFPKNVTMLHLHSSLVINTVQIVVQTAA